MVALQIREQKKFMEKLLCEDMFHHFLVEEAVIHSAAVFTVDGHINREFFNGDEAALAPLEGLGCLPFSMLQKQIFSLIRGTHTPTFFKIVFKLSPQNLENTLSSLSTPFTVHDINGIYLNLHFKNGKMTLTPAISYRSFSPDRSLDQEWDKLAGRFLTKHNVAYEIL